jgi:hypothetical protein
MATSTRRLLLALTAAAGALLGAACGDTLIDSSNTTVRDQGKPPPGGGGNGQTCNDSQAVCGPTQECFDQTAKPDGVCGASCLPCPPPPANAQGTCTVTGKNDGVCGFDCDDGYLKTSNACVPPALIAAGGAFSCAATSVADGGEVHCWGANDKGQLGVATTTASRNTAGRIAGLSGVTALAAGSAHACAVASGAVRCWGDPAGWGSSGAPVTTPVPVAALAGASALAAGAAHTCAIVSGAVKCVGEPNASGNGTPAIGGTALQVAAGDAFTCALVDAGGGTRAVRCWGADDQGQLGDGVSGLPQATPKTVPLSGTLLALAAGARHACVATTASPGPVTCWGDNRGNQLGTFTAPLLGPTANTRVNKPALSSSQQPVAAGGTVTCVVLDDFPSKPLNCFGTDTFSAGGVAVAGEENHITGANVPDPPAAVSIGNGHGCLIGPAALLQCWGHGESGQLGAAADTSSQTLVLVRDR